MNQTLVLQGFYHFCGLNSGLEVLELERCGGGVARVVDKFRGLARICDGLWQRDQSHIARW